MTAKTYDLNGNILDNGECMTTICTETPNICGSPPPPCNPCGDEPKMVCRPIPTRNAIKLRGGEIGRYFKFQSTFTDPNWYAHAHKMSITLRRMGGDNCCRKFCFAPSGVTNDGRIYYAWSKDFMLAPAGYYLATFAVDGHTYRETVVYKPSSYVSVHMTWGDFDSCNVNGVHVPVSKGCGCAPDICCTHLPEAIQEEFVDQATCGECNVGCN